jgi:hypothetical protein
MRFRILACGTILVLGLSLPITLTAEAGLKAKSPPAPLQLSRFMRTAPAKPPTRAARKHPAKHRNAVAARKHTGSHRHAAVTHRNKPKTSPATKPVPVEAAAAFAALPQPAPQPPVREVASGEINDIDRAAGPAPAETTGTRRIATVQLVEATDYNDIDRKSDDALPASFAEPTPPAPLPASQTGAGSSMSPSMSWSARLWATLQQVFAAIASGWRSLLG